MTIKLKVGQKVKCRNELEGEVVYYKKYHSGDTQPFGVKLNGMVEPCWYTEDGHYYATKEEHRHDIVEILTEEKETMEIKARYFEEGNLMFIQNVKESSIMVLDVFHNEIVSVMDYGSPIKAKEQMYTYATLLEVEVKTH